MVGRRLWVSVDVTDPAAGPTAIAPTLHIRSTATIAKGDFAKVPAPKISGTVRAGKKVSVSLGSWSPKPSTYSYAWYLGSTKVGTGRTYTLPSGSRGKKLSVKVTGKATAYNDKTVTSAGKTVS